MAHRAVVAVVDRLPVRQRREPCGHLPRLRVEIVPPSLDPLLAVAHRAVVAVVDRLPIRQRREARRHGPELVVEEVPLAVDLLLAVNQCTILVVANRTVFEFSPAFPCFPHILRLEVISRRPLVA